MTIVYQADYSEYTPSETDNLSGDVVTSKSPEVGGNLDDRVDQANDRNRRTIMYIYTKFLVRHPYVVLGLVTIVALSTTVISLSIKKLPDFTDPTMGFETRGTKLSDRLISWRNLLEETRPSGSLAGNPKDILDELQYMKSRNRSNYTPKVRNGKKKHHKDVAGKVKKIKNIKGINNNAKKVIYLESPSNSTRYDSNSSWDEHEHYGYGKNLSYLSQENEGEHRQSIRNQWITLKNLEFPPSLTEHHHLSDDGFFCGVPMPDYAHLVFKSIDGSSLMSSENLRSMCVLQQQLIEAGGSVYPALCQQSRPPDEQCCPPWSLPNYVALLTNSSSCMDIQDEDISNVLSLLSNCAIYFHSLKLATDCETEHCLAPPLCYKFNAVFNILSYLVDADFLPPNNNTKIHVESSMIFLPLACSASIMPYYHKIEDAKFEYNNVTLVAMDLGVKNAVFDKWLVHDTWLVGLGGVFVIGCMWLYSGSLFLTISTCLAVIYSIGISYFLYTLLFNMSFFPFMNLLTAVVAVGIGADDMFIFVKVWQSHKDVSIDGLTSLGVEPSRLVDLMTDTLEHATLTMFVTSLTTAAAFYASYISNITAVNCFSIFTGTVVIVNFILMITWLPASFTIMETLCSTNKNKIWEMKIRPVRQAMDDFWGMMNRFLVVSVMKLRWFWLISLGCFSIFNGVIIIYYPGLKLPDSRSFQLFHSSQILEQYDLVYKDNYWFERSNKDWNGGNKLPLRWVWGVIPVDTGNPLNPASHGSLVLDSSFNISDQESQNWLMDFCIHLKSQPFYQPVLGPLLPNCFLENFRNWMARRCYDDIDLIDRSPCCETSNFPYPSPVFEICIVQAITALYQTPREFFLPGVAGPKFSKTIEDDEIPRVAALVVEFESNISFSMSYEAMEEFFEHLENWTQNELKTAPPGMKNGWFISELEFYDLQKTLSRGTLMAIGVSMAIALGVLLIVTLNILISFYAILTITLSICVTVGSLVSLGWRLNILESLAVSTAIGLAVDFSLHVGLAYRRAEGTREARAPRALAAAGPPTAMAALTTGVAGALMLPARVLPYTQIGLFLTVVMTVGWTFATFFLGSLLRVAGPEKQFGQFSYPRLQRGRGTVSSTGSAATGVTTGGVAVPLCAAQPPSEGHELRQIPRPPIHDQSPSATSAITIILADEADSHNK